MDHAESQERQIIKMLLEMLEEAIVEAKAKGTALRVLSRGRNWQGLVAEFERQIKPQIAPVFDQGRRLFLQDRHEVSDEIPLPSDWEDTVRSILEGGGESQSSVDQKPES